MALALVLALLPLLPSGPEYLALPAGAWVEAVVVLLLVVVLISLLLETRASPKPTPGERGTALSIVAWGWVVFAVAAMGATAVGVISENEVLTPVFRAYLQELPANIIVPMNQATHPLYPLRVGLTFLEGLLAFVLVVWICRRASNPKRRALTALGGWSAGFALTAAFAGLQYITRFHLHPYWVAVNPALVRSHSTLDDPNALGSYMVLGLGVTSGLLIGWRGQCLAPATRWVISSAVALGLVGLASTVSRAAWLALPLGVILLLASPLPLPSFDSKTINRLRRPARLAILAMLAAMILLIASRLWVPTRPGYKPSSVREAVLATLDPRVPLQDVLEGRFTWWTAGSRMFVEHPVTGVGLGRFPRLLPEYQETRQIHENAHNFYLQVAAVMGSVGLAAFLFLVATIGVALGAALKNPGEDGGWSAFGTTLGVLALLLTCITGHPFLLPSIQLLFSTALAACLVATCPNLENSRRRWGFSAVALVLAGLLAYGFAAIRTPGPTITGAPWGYAWGLHDIEAEVGEGAYRWTGREALLYLLPPPGARVLVINFAAPQPTRDGTPTEVRMRLEGETHRALPSDEQWTRVFLRLPEEPLHGWDRGVVLQVRVDPPLVPLASGHSTDGRELGVMLRRPRFRRDEPRN